MTFLLLFNSLKFSKTSSWLQSCNFYNFFYDSQVEQLRKSIIKAKKLEKSANDFFIAFL